MSGKKGGSSILLTPLINQKIFLGINKTMKKKIKVSFIGAGNMSNEHLKVLNRNKFFVLGEFTVGRKKKFIL